jgi:DNA-binding MarR family transcriptional regulator
MSRAGQEVADRIHSAAVHLVRTVRAVDAAMGLSPARSSVLSILTFGGPRTIGGLARAEGVRSPTMTSVVNGLEADGLVRRTPGHQDGRRVLVEATSTGQRILEQGRRQRVERLQELLGDLDDSELAVLDKAASLIEACLAGAIGPATGAPNPPDDPDPGPHKRRP